MPFTRPTLTQLIERAAVDIEARLPGTDARVRRNLLRILARMHAATAHGLYDYLNWISRQVMPDTADAEILARHASIWQIVRKAAAAAKGNITVTGTNAVTVPAGTLVQRSDGTQYTTDADGTIATGTAAIAVTASTGGAVTNTAANSTLTFATPIAGVNSTATVAAAGLTGGTDTETDDSLRGRLLARLRRLPSGGARDDYVAWALEVSGVTRAWVYPQAYGDGTVLVRCMTDDATANGIPTAAKIAEVQAYIDERRPVAADFSAAAPIAVALNCTIAVVPNTQSVRDAVTAELTDMIRRDAEPGATIFVSRIREAISIAAGETSHTLVSPAADVAHAASEIAVMGAITWA